MKPWNDPENPFLGDANLRDFVASDDTDRLMVRGKQIPVTWIYCDSRFREHDDIQCLWALCYDECGNFYGIRAIYGDAQNARRSIHKLTGKGALEWFACHASWDEKFTRELCRAFDNPQFAFMDLLPVNGKPKRRRRARAEAQPGHFHEQLHMATALVDCLRKLDAEPSAENLSQACRAASEIHQSIHQPENFKAVANG